MRAGPLFRFFGGYRELLLNSETIQIRNHISQNFAILFENLMCVEYSDWQTVHTLIRLLI